MAALEGGDPLYKKTSLGIWGLEYIWSLVPGGGRLWRRSYLFPIALSTSLTFIFPVFLSNAADPSRESQVKAAFLFNFAQFVEWPPGSFPNKDSPLVIGIYGTDPFGSFLDETVRDEVLRGRRIEARRCQNLAEIQSCHILFISQSEASNLDHILAETKGKPVLTVSDIPSSRQHGIIIWFTTEQNRIRFHVSNEAAKEAGLSISSKLLRAAQTPIAEKK
jgi:hypothetical protein